MADLRIEEYNVGDIGTNCYFIVNADTKEMVIIDPGGDGADLIRRIKERGLKLQAVPAGGDRSQAGERPAGAGGRRKGIVRP